MQKLAACMLVACGVSAKSKLKLNHLSEDMFLKAHAGEIEHEELTSISINTVAPCQYVTESAFFNLAGITTPQDLNNKDQIDNQEVGGGLSVKVNFCEDPMPTDDKCTDADAFAFIKTQDKCFGVKSEDDKIDTTGTEIRNGDGQIYGLSLKYISGKNMCEADNTKNYDLHVNLTCNTESNDDQLHFVNVTSPDGCDITLNYRSVKGCPVFTMDAFTQFIYKYSYLWGAALIVGGIILAFFGNKFVNLVIFLTFFFASFCILGSLFFYMFMDKVEEDWAKWLCLAAIIVVSGLLGYFIVRLRKWGIALAAAWGGVLLGFVITSAFVISATWAYYCVLVGCGLVAFFFALKTQNTVMIGVTSFVGSYAIVRGISLYAGGFPSETELHQQIKTGAVDWASYDKKFYIYLGAIVILTFLSFYRQWRAEKNLRSSLHQMKRPIL